MSNTGVKNLVVHAKDGREDVHLPPTSTRYQIVKAFVNLALALLDTPEGRQSLANIATEIIRARDNVVTSSRRRPKHIYRDSMNNMPYWIDVFLQKMKDGFPPVVIGNTKNSDAISFKSNWGEDMSDYDAHGAGFLWVNEGIVDNMEYVRQQPSSSRSGGVDSYQLYKFQMTISVAHEIVHFLTGFITGTAEPHTPRQITAEPYNDQEKVGEAGRYWEVNLLGGFVECWSSPTHPLGVRQPGTPYLFSAGSLQAGTGRAVAMTYIQEFLDERFSFPIRASSGAVTVTRGELKRAKSIETSILRDSPAFRKLVRPSSPTPDQPGASSPARFRGIKVSSEYGYADMRAGAGRGYYR